MSDNHTVSRTFTYDTAGRRIGTTDPDSDRLSGGTAQSRTWRYLFNRVGDLVAVRDSRGCGQNFYYDHAARLVAEDYIACGESAAIRENSGTSLPAGAILLERVTSNTSNLEVRYYFEAAPSWATGYAEVSASDYAGRLAAVSDRGQRSVMAYDDRGLVTWTLRQMTVIPVYTPTVTTASDGRPLVSGTMPTTTRVYDTAHSYSRTASYDHGGRPIEMTLPLDPDFSGTAPRFGVRLSYNPRGLPEVIDLLRDDTPGDSMANAAVLPIITDLVYERDGLVSQVTYGDVHAAGGGSRDATVSTMLYDNRRRPTSVLTEREATGTGSMGDPRPLAAVTRPFYQELSWDVADNLVEIADLRDPMEWPDGYRPQSTAVAHDALYRVVLATYSYETDSGVSATDTPSDWRTEAALSRSNDPMASRPAPMIDDLPSSRPMYMDWEYDWLGNAQSWNDDANQFYERSLGDISNGTDATNVDRPGAIRLATNIGPNTTHSTVDRGGWLQVDYGLDGNVTAMTVHADCHDDTDDGNGDTGTEICRPNPAINSSHNQRVAYLADRCICNQEQHYTYRWDEVNRIAEAYRFERTGGSGAWTMMVRQRYLYDSANDRTVKQTLDQYVMASVPEAVALYVFPGDFERRGLVRNVAGTSYDALSGAETQYVIGGARVVYRDATHGGSRIDRDQRITIGLSDLIQSTSATLDLVTGELVETNNYYANGARESYRGSTVGERVAPEPMGFTGKEADEEVGLTYFGQRYLMAHLGRWASPDPLQVHAVGGGEALNGYHYVAGSLLQARDPMGLDGIEQMRYAMKSLLDGLGIAATAYRSAATPSLVQGYAGDAYLAYQGAIAMYAESTSTMYLDTTISASNIRDVSSFFHEYTHHVVNTTTDPSVVAAIALVQSDLVSAGHSRRIDMQETIAYYLANVVEETAGAVAAINGIGDEFARGDIDRAEYDRQIGNAVGHYRLQRQAFRDNLLVAAGGLDYAVDLADSTASELERAFLGASLSDNILDNPGVRSVAPAGATPGDSREGAISADGEGAP